MFYNGTDPDIPQISATEPLDFRCGHLSFSICQCEWTENGQLNSSEIETRVKMLGWQANVITLNYRIKTGHSAHISGANVYLALVAAPLLSHPVLPFPSPNVSPQSTSEASL